MKDIKNNIHLPCQEIRYFYRTQKLPLPESFKVEGLFNSSAVSVSYKEIEFLISCVQNAPQEEKFTSPTWAGIRSLITAELPNMHVRFLPFIPHPVTEYSTVYTAMINFTKAVKQLHQNVLPIFCDEGMFRIVLDIFFAKSR